MTDLFSFQLLDKDRDEILALILQLKAKCKPIMDVTPKDINNRQYMGQASRGFVQEGILSAKVSPELIPPLISVAEMEKDWAFVQVSDPIVAELIPLARIILFANQAAGQDLMEATNFIYESHKRAAKGDKKYKSATDKLGERYKQSKSDKEKPIVIK